MDLPVREFAHGDVEGARAFVDSLESDFERACLDELVGRFDRWRFLVGDDIRHVREHLGRIADTRPFRIRALRGLPFFPNGAAVDLPVREFARGDLEGARAFLESLQTDYKRVCLEEVGNGREGWRVVVGDEIRHVRDHLDLLTESRRFRIRALWPVSPKRKS